VLRRTRTARKKHGPRHERVIVCILNATQSLPLGPHIVLPGAILSVWQIEENPFGNVLLIIVNGFFTLSALVFSGGMDAPLCGQQCGQSGAGTGSFGRLADNERVGPGHGEQGGWQHDGIAPAARSTSRPKTGGHR
jgi:hypothetical protein